MRIVKKLLGIVLCAVVVLGGLMIPSTSKAAGAKTFTCHWDGANWYFNTTENNTWMNVSIIPEYFNSGDKIVVDGLGGGASALDLTISKYVAEFCVGGSAYCTLNASAGVGTAYAVTGGTAVVNANVDKAVASGSGVLQVNGNVNSLDVSYKAGYPTFAITGTVGVARAKNKGGDIKDYYNIKAGKCIPDSVGDLQLNEGDYSSVAAPSGTPTAPGNGNGGLDKVPKTGSFALETSVVLVLLAIMFGCASVVVLRKKSR